MRYGLFEVAMSADRDQLPVVPYAEAISKCARGAYSTYIHEREAIPAVTLEEIDDKIKLIT
jgi:hypothetical protein